MIYSIKYSDVYAQIAPKNILLWNGPKRLKKK